MAIFINTVTMQVRNGGPGSYRGTEWLVFVKTPDHVEPYSIHGVKAAVFSSSEGELLFRALRNEMPCRYLKIVDGRVCERTPKEKILADKDEVLLTADILYTKKCSALRQYGEKKWAAMDLLRSQENDHACVLVAVSFMHEALGEAIRRVLLGGKVIEERLLGLGSKGFERPLSTLSSRIHIGYALGIYGSVAYNDMIVLNKIRNMFAHSTVDPDGKNMKPLSFNHRKVVDQCCRLKLPEIFRPFDYSNVKNGSRWEDAPRLPAELDPRKRFLGNIDLIANFLLYTSETTWSVITPSNNTLP